MKRILVIEDEDDVRRNLIDLLEAEGYSTLSAKNGSEGFEIALSNEPDLILSDIRMPKMDGYELLEKLQKNPATALIPFIFLTAKVEMQDLRKGMSIGADDYIVKPFKIDDVLNAINSRLRKKDNYLSVIQEFNEVLIKKVPHELRTPLVGILGLSSIICDDIVKIPRNEIKEIAERIKYSGNRLHRRIEKFLTYTELIYQTQNKKNNLNIDANNYELEPESLASRLFEKAEEFNRKNDLIVHFEKSKIKITPFHFSILLNELLENSLKFSEHGTPILIEGKNYTEFYEIEISDEGIRHGEINLENVRPFNMFDRKNMTDEGLGMGLAIVKKIINLNQGKINFKNNDKDSGVIEIGIPLSVPIDRSPKE